MNRTKIEGSSNIMEVGYDMPTLTLEIKFNNGSVYQYWPVRRGTYDAMMKAKSKGGYFFKKIKGQTEHYLRMDT